jgi:hypothetical protein
MVETEDREADRRNQFEIVARADESLEMARAGEILLDRLA